MTAPSDPAWVLKLWSRRVAWSALKSMAWGCGNPHQSQRGRSRWLGSATGVSMRLGTVHVDVRCLTEAGVWTRYVSTSLGTLVNR